MDEGFDAWLNACEEEEARPVHHVDIVYREAVREQYTFLPGFLKLVLFGIMLKPTSVDCERVFSYRTLYKTDRRARLSAERLSQCLWLRYNTSGDLATEAKSLLAAAKEYRSGTNMQMFNNIAEKIENQTRLAEFSRCLLYTSDAADE